MFVVECFSSPVSFRFVLFAFASTCLNRHSRTLCMASPVSIARKSNDHKRCLNTIRSIFIKGTHQPTTFLTGTFRNEDVDDNLPQPCKREGACTHNVGVVGCRRRFTCNAMDALDHSKPCSERQRLARVPMRFSRMFSIVRVCEHVGDVVRTKH